MRVCVEADLKEKRAQRFTHAHHFTLDIFFFPIHILYALFLEMAMLSLFVRQYTVECENTVRT